MNECHCPMFDIMNEIHFHIQHDPFDNTNAHLSESWGLQCNVDVEFSTSLPVKYTIVSHPHGSTEVTFHILP